MSSRCLFRLAVVSAAVAAGIAASGPASAAVTYDPATRTGFVDRADLRDAFGWTDAMLASQAADVAFEQDFWINDTYSGVCEGKTFAYVHHREYGRFALVDELAYHRERGTATGYLGKLIGFRISGATSGISGTSPPPAAGQPCPEAPDGTIDRVDLVSSATGWALAAIHSNIRQELLRSPVALP